MAPVSLEQYAFVSTNDEMQSRTLTTMQRHSIENLLRETIMEKVNMPADTPDYLLKQEFARGQMSILQYILALDDTTKTTSLETQG